MSKFKVGDRVRLRKLARIPARLAGLAGVVMNLDPGVFDCVIKLDSPPDDYRGVEYFFDDEVEPIVPGCMFDE